MKSRPLFQAAILLLLASTLSAQGTQSFIVMSVIGTVHCVEYPGADQSRLVQGQALGMEAVVSLTTGASARLLYQDQSITLKEAGNYPLKSLVANLPSNSSSFLKRFFNYVYEGIVNTSGSKQIEKYHELYLTQSSGGIKGFAGADYGISLTQPVMGNIIPFPARFEWFSAGDSVLYDFHIVDFQTDGLIFKALLRDTVIVVNLEQLAVEPGRKYYWVVQQKRLGEMAIGFPLADDPYMRSPKVEFVISNQQLSDLTKDLEASEAYKNGVEIDRFLMMAQTMEEANYPSWANRILLEALGKEPANPLIRKVYAAFLIRQGLWEAAQHYL
ncbi:MAG: hypothetical protein IPJ40_02300 [Saprospirales bacterium]|nr:hypothetical protein [Saprospirales bacterium]